MVVKVSSPNMMSQIPRIHFHSESGHFWFVEALGDHQIFVHGAPQLHKTNLKELICFMLDN